MKALEIQPSEWDRFLDTFSQQHAGWLVTVEEIPTGGGAPRVEARELPLQGLFSDPHDQSIFIAVGRTTDHHLTHTVSHPVRIVVEQSDTGADEGLTIERENGRSTRIKFKDAVRPEEADGLPRRRANEPRSR
jgi:hypothetical protein